MNHEQFIKVNESRFIIHVYEKMWKGLSEMSSKSEMFSFIHLFIISIEFDLV